MNNITMALNADELILSALREDITSEDITTNSVMREYQLGEVELICKQDGVIAGLDVFKRTFELLDSKTEVTFTKKDGDTVKNGDKIELKDPYSNKTYKFEVAGSYTYDAVISVFMNRDMFIKTFDKDDDYYSGYFSNKKLTDIDDDYIASIITVKDLRKVSTQMKVSMGSFMDMVKYFGVIMFILLMYLLSKQIIEKNSNSIALTKILGYSDMEIGGLYIITTFVVVVISLLLAIPIVNIFLHEMFTSYLYTQMTGYVPYIISNSCYVKMFIMGVLSYLVVCVIQMAKIRKIPKSDALKNVE